MATLGNLTLTGPVKRFADYEREAEEFALKRQLANAQIQSAASGGNDPAALRLANEYLAAKQSGDVERANAIEAFAKTREKNVMLMPDGSYVPLQGMPQALGALKYGEQSGAEMAKTQYEPQRAGMVEGAKLEQQLGYAPRIEADKQTSKMQAEYFETGRQSLPKAGNLLQSKELKEGFLNEKIDSIRSRATGMTTGFTGSILGAVPGTAAYDLRRDVDTLLANAGFDRLQEMRDNSPTGGALGQVSNIELVLLQSAAESLVASQSREQFLTNLDNFQRQREASLRNIQQAYNEDLQRFGGQEMMSAPQARQTTNPAMTTPYDQIQPDMLVDEPAAIPPKKGQVVDGYMFSGGNPNDPKSWKKVK